MFCSNCNSKDLNFGKSASYTKGIGMTYAYWYRCKSCKYFQFIPRTRENYDLVKEAKWKKTKSLRRLQAYT